jgi:hypothetical protein
MPLALNSRSILDDDDPTELRIRIWGHQRRQQPISRRSIVLSRRQENIAESKLAAIKVNSSRKAFLPHITSQVTRCNMMTN